MDENMVTSFFLFLTQVTSIRNPPTPLFKLIQNQNLGPSCFPSKKTNSQGHPRIPNNTMGEQFHFSIGQGGVEGLNKESTILHRQSYHGIIGLHRQGVC